MGTVLSIDPASKSLGYAIFEGGIQVEAGTLKTSEKQPVGRRLFDLLDQLEDVIRDYRPIDIMLIELVRSSTGHIFLTWAAGMAVAASDAPVVIEIPEKMWKKTIDDQWFKCDVQDAKYIAKLAFVICEDEDGKE